MRKTILCAASLMASAVVLVVSGTGGVSGNLLAGGKASISGTWRYAYGGQVQVIKISDRELVETITGAGMPPAGVVMKKKIAAIRPDPSAPAGTIVTGPAENLMKPYEVYHWYELEGSRVKFYIAGKQFDSVDEAAGSKGNPAQARRFERIK